MLGSAMSSGRMLKPNQVSIQNPGYKADALGLARRDGEVGTGGGRDEETTGRPPDGDLEGGA